MHRTDVWRRAAGTVLLVSFLCALLAGQGLGANAIGYPNPRSGQYIKIDTGDPSYTPVPYIFSWTDPALADGGNGTGAQHKLEISEYDGSPARTWVQQPNTWIKGSDNAETFTWDSSTAQITPLDPLQAPYVGIRKKKSYVWRVTVAFNGPLATVPEWLFHVPMIQPADAAQDVGATVKFIWDPHPDPTYGGANLQGSPFYERLHIIDLDSTLPSASYPKTWVTIAPSGATTMVDQHIKKTYDPSDQNPENRMRRYWIYDTNWFLIGTTRWPRLFPGRNYAMRISYWRRVNNAPVALFNDRNLNNSRDIGDEFIWADLGPDDAPGWTFRTIDELDTTVYGAATTESAIIYWQSQYGTSDRDMPDYSFKREAQRLQAIHHNNHYPFVETVIAGTQEIAASYGAYHNESNIQPAFADAVIGYSGWYTITRATKAQSQGFSTAQQDLYEEYVARGIRTFLQDAANGGAFEGVSAARDDRASMDNLQYIVLLGDAARVAPSFYYYNGVWVPTDFFYSAQNDQSAVITTPHYQVGRIPIRAKNHLTTNPIGQDYDVELPYVGKFRDYATLLNSESKKAAAYTNWFGRAVMVAGSTEYSKWYQFYPAVVQYLTSRRVPIGGGLFRDTFSGIKVRAYNIWGRNQEALNAANVLRHMYNPSDPADVPGFIYLLTRGVSLNGDGAQIPLTPNLSIPATQFGLTYPNDVTDGRRPLVISSGDTLALFDSAIFQSNVQSAGETSVLAPGGSIGFIGFSSDIYSASVTHTFNYTPTSTYSITWSGNVDEDGGYTYPNIVQGQMSLARAGDADFGATGRAQFIRMFADEYAKSVQPGIGNILNRALASYIAANAESLAGGEQRVTSTVFGATLLGDPAFFLPARQRSVKDNTQPVVADTNPRPDTAVAGYDPQPRYNSWDMPVHVIPRGATWDPTGTTNVNVALDVRTDAPSVRVRVLTPFKQNTSYVPGHWHDQTGLYWASSDPEIVQTVDSACSFTFNLRAPSLFIVVVQAQNPAWVQGVDSNEWRWLKERWFWIQGVNQFVRDPGANILVIDEDQMDRYHLNDNWNAHVENYYVTAGRDAEGYTVGAQDPRNDAANFPNRPALPVLNKELGEDLGLDARYRYQQWSVAPYQTNPSFSPNDNTLLQNQRFYGEICPHALKSFEDTRGLVLWFSGHENTIYPNGYLFHENTMTVQNVKFLSQYLDNGGRLFMTNQELHQAGPSFIRDFQEDYLGGVTAWGDTNCTNMDGLQTGTLSEFIQDVNVAGGDGENNATATGEVDPNGTEAKTIFVWHTGSGPGTIVSSGSSAVQNRILANGTRTVYFTWPFEAIDHVGLPAGDAGGRANIMRAVCDWLRSVPRPLPVNPPDGATGVSRLIILQWTRVAEASYYKIFIGTDPNNLTGPGAVVVRDNPWYDPANPANPADPLLVPNTRYYWRVDCLNRDYATETTGDVWSFTTIAPPVKSIQPSPAHMATQVPLNQVLGWNNLGVADRFDVYLWSEDAGGAGFNPAVNSVYHLGRQQPAKTLAPPSPLTAAKTYYWRVDSWNELSYDPAGAPPATPAGMNLGPTKGDVWQFSTITVPPKPQQPTPPHLAVQVPTAQVLGWQATDRTDSYDIFIWTGNPAAVPATPTATGLLTNSYTPAVNLNTSTTYYWQVRPVNAAGRQNTVDTWQFTTSSVASPARVVIVAPLDGAVNVPVNIKLDWLDAAGAARYNVYLGIGSVPAAATASGLTASEFQPPADLQPGTIYFWRVDSVAADGLTITAGTEQSFTTLGISPIFPPASNPSPADGATNVAIAGLRLSWTQDPAAQQAQVYINGNLVATVAGPGGTINFTFVAGTTYTWRVDLIYAGSPTPVPGPNWTFTTAGTAPPPPGGGSSNCFLATAAYESAAGEPGSVPAWNFTGRYRLAPENDAKLRQIRAVRDGLLLNLEAGRQFSAWYYAVGPYAAAAVRHNEPAKAAVRALLLDPLSVLSRSCGVIEEQRCSPD